MKNFAKSPLSHIYNSHLIIKWTKKYQKSVDREPIPEETLTRSSMPGQEFYKPSARAKHLRTFSLNEPSTTDEDSDDPDFERGKLMKKKNQNKKKPFGGTDDEEDDGLQFK